MFREWQANPDMPPVMAFRRPRELDEWLAHVAVAATVRAPGDSGHP